MSILFTAKKKDYLPDSIINKLIELLNKPYGSFIVLILSQCKETMATDELSLETLSTKLDSEDMVVEQENSMVKIEKRNNSNKDSTSIALLATQSILNALEISEKIIETVN